MIENERERERGNSSLQFFSFLLMASTILFVSFFSKITANDDEITLSTLLSLSLSLSVSFASERKTHTHNGKKKQRTEPSTSI